MTNHPHRSKTPHFHEGQEVEVPAIIERDGFAPGLVWRKAEIVRMAPDGGAIFNPVYEVQFPDGTRAVFDEEHIRAVNLRWQTMTLRPGGVASAGTKRQTLHHLTTERT